MTKTSFYECVKTIELNSALNGPYYTSIHVLVTVAFDQVAVQHFKYGITNKNVTKSVNASSRKTGIKKQHLSQFFKKYGADPDDEKYLLDANGGKRVGHGSKVRQKYDSI